MSGKLSVIIPCYNAAATLGVQLAAIASQRYAGEWEVLVADNGSSDGSQSIVQRYAGAIPGLRVIDASHKRGAPHARNIGAAAATGAYLLFCDADDEMAPGYLQEMSDALDRNGFVTCRYDYTRLNTSWLATARQPGQAGSEAEGGVALGGFCHPTLPYAGGGGLGIRKALHDGVGGFDTSLRAAAGQEDTDYCIRVQLAGATLDYVPSAVMHIRSRTTITGVFVQAKSWAESGAYIQRRYQPPGVEVPAVGTTIVSLSKHLIWLTLHLRGRRDVAQLIWQAGWSVGWVEAMLRMRGYLAGAPDQGATRTTS